MTGSQMKIRKKNYSRMTKNSSPYPYPSCLVVNGKAYILTDDNEDRVACRLHKLYKPTQIVEEWIDGNKINELELQDIFNIPAL